MDRTICNAVWALLGNSVTMTLQDVELLGEVMPRDALDYLEELIRAGYVRFSGCKRLAAGEYETTFRQVKRTGDYAPHVDDEGNFIDPNVEQACRGGSRTAPTVSQVGATKSNGLPSFAARMRMAAEQFGRPFSRDEARLVMNPRGDEKRQFTFAWHTLCQRHVFTQLEVPGQPVFVYEPNPITESIRGFFKIRLGTVLTATDLPATPNAAHAGMYIRSALDLLAAEGYRITITPKHGGKPATYRVDAPETLTQPSP